MSNCFQSIGALGSLDGVGIFRFTPKPKPPVMISAPAPIAKPLTYSETLGISHQAIPDTATLVSAPSGSVQAQAQAQAQAQSSGFDFSDLPVIPIAIGILAIILLTGKK